MVDTFDKLLLELERCLMGTTRCQPSDEFKRESVGLPARRHGHKPRLTVSREEPARTEESRGAGRIFSRHRPLQRRQGLIGQITVSLPNARLCPATLEAMQSREFVSIFAVPTKPLASLLTT